MILRQSIGAWEELDGREGNNTNKVNVYENFKVEKYNLNSCKKENMQIQTSRKELGCSKKLARIYVKKVYPFY